MTKANPIRTPTAPATKQSAYKRQPLQDSTEYRNIIGGLQYLIWTWPDLAFAINQVSQFMHNSY